VHETASYEPSCVKIGSVVFAVGDGKKKRKGREGTKSHASHLFVGIYAGHNHLCKFWFGKIKRFGIYGGQILESPIEMAGHPYNSAALLRNP